MFIYSPLCRRTQKGDILMDAAFCVKGAHKILLDKYPSKSPCILPIRIFLDMNSPKWMTPLQQGKREYWKRR